MSMMQSQSIPYEMKSSLIRIHSYQGKNLQGTLQNPFFEGEQSFDNLTQFLLLLENMLDAMDFPQRTMTGREFDRPEAGNVTYLSPAGLRSPGRPVIATFQLSILFRHNASWQGSLLWLDRSTKLQFRSALELVGLLDSALAPWE